MRSLYVRIYLAVLASLALFAILAGVTWRIFYGFEHMGPRSELYVEAAERLAPPADAAPAEQQRQLDHWRQLSGYDLAIFSAEGRILAQAAEDTLPSPLDGGNRPSMRQWRGPFGVYAVRLNDGRWLVAARSRADRGPWPRFGWLAALLGIACAVGIAAYPVVRRLTRGIERLEASVLALGAGDLSSRVEIDGHDEVARLAANYNRAADRIAQLIRSNKSLLANASHELRSPLARLRMGLEGVQDTMAMPMPARAEFARNIAELDELIEEILLASRLEAEVAAQLSFEAVDLVALAAEECARSGAELAVFPANGLVMSGDPRLLRRLVRNLLENAKRHGRGSPVEVEIASAATVTEFDVLDRGPGVPAAERERIFEPFYRLPGTREGDGSVGLGLSLARQIAERHGGTVVCLSRDGGGSCFRVSLPRTAGGFKLARA